MVSDALPEAIVTTDSILRTLGIHLPEFRQGGPCASFTRPVLVLVFTRVHAVAVLS